MTTRTGFFPSATTVAACVGLGVTAYDAGLSAGLAQNGNIVVAPGYPVAGYYGWGFGHGFGFFGFLGGLLFLFLLIALIRAAFGGPRRGWGGGWGGGHGHGWYPGGWRDEQGRTWEDRAREAHDAWLLTDFRRSDPIALGVLNLDNRAEGFGSRRWFYLLPARGQPQKLLHAIEPTMLDAVPGAASLYSSWRTRDHLTSLGWRRKVLYSGGQRVSPRRAFIGGHRS